jgi:hypothetical protein
MFIDFEKNNTARFATYIFATRWRDSIVSFSLCKGFEDIEHG